MDMQFKNGTYTTSDPKEIRILDSMIETTMDTERKTYILQKDLPDTKAGAEFIIGKEVDAYYLVSDKTGTKYNCYCYPKDFVELNDEWFKLKEEEKPLRIRYADEYENKFKFISTKDEVFFISKERLAEILIAEGRGELYTNGNMPKINTPDMINYLLNNALRLLNEEQRVVLYNALGERFVDKSIHFKK